MAAAYLCCADSLGARNVFSYPFGAGISGKAQTSFDAATMCMIATVFVVMVVFFRITDLALPHRRLLNLGTARFARPMTPAKRYWRSFRPASWRTDSHRLGFQVASAIERCLPGFRRRLGSDDLKDVYTTFGTLAAELRHRAIDAEEDDKRRYFEMLLRNAIGLIVVQNPVALARSLRAVLPTGSVAPVNTRRMRAVLESASVGLQGIAEGFESIRKAVVALIVIVVIGWLLAGGHLGELVGRLATFK